MSRIVVLGASGAMGRRVAARLSTLGHDVVAASRVSGIDAHTGMGLESACRTADVVVDCLNITTTRRRRAQDFFGTTARHVCAAAAATGVGHLVVLSIVNVTDDTVRRSLGYYAGKATHEQVYAACGLPTTIVATTAWFELAEAFVHQARLGPLAFVPTMTLQPVHPDAVAHLLVEVALGPAPTGVARVELAGPETIRADDMARRLTAARESGIRVVGVPCPLRGNAARTAMLPGPGARIDERRYAAWLPETPQPPA